jgi:pilus assembly protein CpaE
MYPLSAGLILESKELWDDLKQAMKDLPVRVSFELPQVPRDWPPFLDRLERVRPDVILLEVAGLGDRLEEVVKRIRSSPAQPAVFAINNSASSEAILAAMRAGATEYLYPPMAVSLAAAFERLSESRQQSRPGQTKGGKVFGFLSVKGGCGGTTVACHVAAELAKQTSSKVLLADLDLQAGLVGFLLKTNSSYTVADAVNNLQRLDHSYWQGLISNGIPNLEIITAPTTPSSKQLPSGHLKQVLAFARTQYDWLVLDLGRNLNQTTLALLDLVDEAFMVTTQEIPALHHAKAMIQTLSEAGYSRSKLHLLLNRVTKRFDVTMEELESMLGLSIFSSLSNDYNSLHEAFSEGRLIESSTELGEDFARLAGKIAGVPEAPRKKKFLLFG